MAVLEGAEVSAWNISFSYIVETFWDMMSPGPGATETTLICRIKGAHGLALTIMGMLSGLLAVEAMYPMTESGNDPEANPEWFQVEPAPNY